MTERLLMSVQDDESEPVLVAVRDDLVDFELDDGRVVTLSRGELLAALDEAA